MQDPEEIHKVAIVGTGNIAWHLARAMYRSGMDITCIISRSMQRAAELSKDVSAIPLDDPANVQEQPDMYLLCVGDDVLPGVQEAYAGKGPLVVHTSGSTGIGVLPADKNPTGVLYPLQTFTRGVEMAYSGIPFLVEGSAEKVTLRLEHLAGKISREVHQVNSEQRRQIHVSAVFACNFSNHLSAIADRLMQQNGLAFDLLLPLIGETTRKLSEKSPVDAQTGPAVRNDLTTIEKHLEALGNLPEEQEIYRLLTESIMRYRKETNE
ncbi:MAG: Rossmann-like and DUF2520 domain-containing protein [Bacteroidales bacterium]|nr:Rossmann-like and DUF2520 domain-containing protein [Bacteroidales bacterium]